MKFGGDRGKKRKRGISFVNVGDTVKKEEKGRILENSCCYQHDLCLGQRIRSTTVGLQHYVLDTVLLVH